MINRDRKLIRATRTVQFTVGNVGFHKNNKILPRNSPLALILTADQCTLKITNQKNGRLGQIISHETILNDMHGPVKAVAR